MTFTYVDAIVAAVIAISAFLAWSRGLTREVMSLGGWIVAALLAFYLAPGFAPLVAELPWIGAKLADSCLILMIASFAIIVALALLILAVFTPILASAVLDSALGPVDRALGFLFGIARGLLLIAVGYLIYVNFVGDGQVAALENAASRSLFSEAAGLVEQYRPHEVPSWLEERISALTTPCGGGEAPAAVLPETPAEQG